ncbi:hypothetical protein ACIQUM_38575 [Amycolatopsis azurea]|uniref:hypothetical protein n=1 Tax=Amycolatopsis azurea TaxID=36819 RepID=UPI00382C83E1
MDDFVDDPDDLAKWGLHCFCLGARSTPHHIVKMDDNGRLLFRARHGVSRVELREQGADPLDSQIALLRAYDLVSVEGDRLTTTFPVLGSEETAALRARMAGLAEAIVPAIEAEVSTLAGVLADQGLAQCAYGVFFGYVIDGLVWDRLREEGLLPVTELSVERPYWNGAFWAVYPPRAGAMGTNEVVEAGAGLTMVWTDPTVNALNRLVGDPALRSALRAVPPGELPRDSLLSDDRGRPGIPIITRQDPIHEIGLRIAANVVSALLRDLPEAGVVVAAHELIWNLMDAVEATGVVRRPSSFDDPEATPDSLRVQMFVSLGD